MNETLIFFKIRGIFKMYQSRSCIYRDRNEQWMKRRFSSKYEVFSKCISLEAVFTETEMNNEWNVDFLQNTRYFQNVSVSKLYLPRQKWTMNETSIFFKIRGIFKMYQSRSCIYWDRNEQWMKRRFSSKYVVFSKCISLEAVFTETEINNEWNVDFL